MLLLSQQEHRLQHLKEIVLHRVVATHYNRQVHRPHNQQPLPYLQHRQVVLQQGRHLFVNHNSCGYGCSGASDITVQPAHGGPQHTIYSSQQYAITNVRAVTENTLLVDINNQPFGNSHVDQSHNGLWAIRIDGTGLMRLTTDTSTTSSLLNNSSQFPWSNVSRDASTYATLQITNLASQHPTYAILTGTLNGGTPGTIASISDGSTLDIAGWSTM